MAAGAGLLLGAGGAGLGEAAAGARSTGNARCTGGSLTGSARRTGGGVWESARPTPLLQTKNTVPSATLEQRFLFRSRESHIGDARLRANVQHADDVSVRSSLIATNHHRLFGI